MTSVTPTRERILDEAMALFARRGFRATTITDIEHAAGLTPGAGGVFHHFATKRDVLVQAVERRFLQLEALNQIRSAIPSLGDRRAELRLFGRYVLDQLEEERDLLAVVLREARDESSLMGDAVRRLFSDRERAFARWLAVVAPEAEPNEDDVALARIALGGLAYSPTVDALLARRSPDVTEAHLSAWVDATLALLESTGHPADGPRPRRRRART